MLNPTPLELLGQVADALAATVLPDLQPGPARDELQAGIAVIRRVARCLPAYRQFLHDDITDMAAALRGVADSPATAEGGREVGDRDVGGGDVRRRDVGERQVGERDGSGRDVRELLARAETLAPTVAPLDDLLARAGALEPTVAPLDELVALDLELRAVVAELASAAAVQAAPGAEDPARSLVPLLTRMTEREAALRLSPWER